MIKNTKDLMSALKDGKKLIRRKQIPFTNWELDDGTVVKMSNLLTLIKQGKLKEVSSMGLISYYAL